MRVLVVDTEESRWMAFERSLQAAACEAHWFPQEVQSCAALQKSEEVSNYDLVILHETDIIERATLADATVPVIVYSGGFLDPSLEAQVSEKVIRFPIPIDRQSGEQRRRYVDYLVGSITGC